MSGLDIGVTLGGLVAIAALAWFFFGPKKTTQAQVRAGVQEVRVTVKGGFSPDIIRVTEGVPLRLVLDRQEAGECSSRIVIPDFQVSKSVSAFATTTLEFTPDRTGSFGFTCGMNMLHGTLNANRLRTFKKPALPAAEHSAREAVTTVEVRDSQPLKEAEMTGGKDAETVKDVVCGMDIDPSTAAASMEHRGKTYHFCSDNCHTKFAAEPQKYAR